MSKQMYEHEELETLMEKPASRGQHSQFVYRNNAKKTYHTRVLVITLLCSLGLNVAGFYRSLISDSHKDIGRSRYSGLGFDHPVKFQSMTDYTSPNETLADELWEAIDTSPIAIAANKSWARDRELPESDDFPWDNDKSNYFVKVFHQLHCLKLLRRYIVDLRSGTESVIRWEHCQHCLDTLRKDVICMADDTPVYGRSGARLGDGQVMWCRNFDKLVAWTQDLERNACYRTLDDYRTIVNSLERYAFCPKDSPYHKIQKDYFDRFGHKDPWGKDE